jgi:hypothetical protein
MQHERLAAKEHRSEASNPLDSADVGGVAEAKANVDPWSGSDGGRRFGLARRGIRSLQFRQLGTSETKACGDTLAIAKGPCNFVSQY